MKSKLAVCLLALVFLLNCKDEDTTGDYIGVWVATNIDITDCENFTNDEFRSVQCNDNTCYRISLNADGTYTFQKGLEFEQGNWSADGAVLTFCFDEEGEQSCSEGTGILNSTGMRLSFEEGPPGCITGYILVREVDDGSSEDED